MPDDVVKKIGSAEKYQKELVNDDEDDVIDLLNVFKNFV